MQPDHKPSFNFRSMLKDEREGKPVLAALKGWLWDPQFRGFDVHVDGFDAREPDGWFHPSTHPLMPERQLFHYMRFDEWIPEVFDPQSTMAVTVGKMLHDFNQAVLMEVGVISQAEAPWVHEPTKSRGNSDGVITGWRGINAIYEYKTCHPRKLAKIIDLDAFKQFCPDYYAQQIEYQRISGYRESRVIMQETSYPYEMQEIVVPYDERFAYDIATKYARVIQAVENDTPPMVCCNKGSAASRACPFRGVCENGSAT